MNEYSDDNVCRICFQKQDTIFSLFRKRKGSSPYDKLVNYTKLKIHVDDGGPCSICLQCLTDLDTTINFLNRCEKSNQILAARCSLISDKKENLNLECDVISDTVPSFSQEDSTDFGAAPLKSNLDSFDGLHSEILVTESQQCPECGSKRRCKHWAPPGTFTCQYCGKVFNRKFNFTLHLKRHWGAREYSCSCGARALTRAAAARHCKPRARRLCPAPGCGRTFTTTTNLNTHYRTHSGERPHDCTECGKSFTCKNTLNDHMRIHTALSERPSAKKNASQETLPEVRPWSSHMLAHTTARPHACAAQGCGRAFKSRRALTLHTTTHAQERRTHACGVCGVRYNHKQSLNKHVKKQHGEKVNASDDIQLDTQTNQ